MKYLTQYIDQQNRYAAFFNSKNKFDVANLTRREINELLERLEGDLSPENLCCDGELRGAALQKKATMLNGAKRELETLL